MRIDSAAALTLRSGAGDITVEHVTGHAEITTGSGEVRVRRLDGTAVIKNSNGDTWVGAAGGDLRVKAANGNVAIDLAQASVVAKTANGGLRVGEAVRDSVVLETHVGDVEIGIREGTDAWLDVSAERRQGAQRARVRRRPPVHRDRRGARAHHARRDRDRPAMITVTGLRKSYGDHLVLDGVDLDRRRGHDLRPARPQRRRQDDDRADPLDADRRRRRRPSGSPATTSRRDPDGVRAAIGVTGQFSAVDNLLTGQENLLLMADLHHLDRAEGRRRAADLLERFDLADAAAKPAATYSGGMRRRLDLAMTLVGDPRLIFLDEPTTGLDPRSRRTMWQIIRDLVAGGVTIFLTTQYLEEADQLADRIAVLDHGRLVAEGTAERAQAARPRRPHPARSSPTPTTWSRPPARSATRRATDDGLALQGPERRQRRLAARRCSSRLDDVARSRAHRPHARPRRRLPRPHRHRTARSPR